MRAQIAARLTPSCCESSAPDTPPLPSARSAERICASVVIIFVLSSCPSSCSSSLFDYEDEEDQESGVKIQSDVHRARGMRQRADGNEIHAALRNGAHGLQIH